MVTQRSTLIPGAQSGAEVTDVVPISAFGIDADLDVFPLEAISDEAGQAEVLGAPELDDLTDTDNLVALRLAYRDDLDDCDAANADALTDALTDVLPRIGQHRKAASAVKSRMLVAAMAVGGVAAATYSVVGPSDDIAHTTRTVLASDTTAMATGNINGTARGVQLVTPATNNIAHSEEFAKGAAFAQERAEREARLQRPLFVKPTSGIFTSGFGYRWGALHAGVDLAAPIGTPIYAVADGVVIDAGPTAGYGAWVKLRHADGTVTLYGHVNTWLVSVGQRVMAGDQVATVGNRGNSTGPHCHFEVMPNGTDRIDPVPWLSQRGISVGAYTG